MDRRESGCPVEGRGYVSNVTLVEYMDSFTFWSVDDKRKREESLQSLPPMDMDMEMVRRCTIGLERKKESGTDLVVGDAEVIAEELLCVVDMEVGREG